MKILLLLTLAASTGHLLAESAVPQPYDHDRYGETVLESPFALATPPTVVEEKEPPRNNLTDLYISGLTRLDGEDYVTVRNLAGDQTIHLLGNKKFKDDLDDSNPNNGMYVEKVNWGDRWNMITVTLVQGANRREGVEFKKQQSAMPGQNPPGGPGGRIGNRFGPPGQSVPQQSIIPGTANPNNVQRLGFQQNGQNLAPGGATRGGPGARGAGNQNFQGGTGTQVPRPGGTSNFRGGGATSGAATGVTPNAGPARQRDRGPVRNGGGR
jgi:hypothetical protein